MDIDVVVDRWKDDTFRILDFSCTDSEVVDAHAELDETDTMGRVLSGKCYSRHA